MNGLKQFVDSIFEPHSFLPLYAITFFPTSNLFVHFSVTQGKIRDNLADFAIAILNSLAKSSLKGAKSSLGSFIANLDRIPNRILNGDFSFAPGRLRYPQSTFPRQSSQLQTLLLTITFCIACFKVPNILSTFAFPLGLLAEVIFQSIDAVVEKSLTAAMPNFGSPPLKSLFGSYIVGTFFLERS